MKERLLNKYYFYRFAYVVTLCSSLFLSACVVSDQSTDKLKSVGQNSCVNAEAIQKDASRVTFSVPEKALEFRIKRNGTTIYEYVEGSTTTQIVDTELTPDQTYWYDCEIVLDYDIGFVKVGNRLELTMPASEPPQFEGIKTLVQESVSSARVGWELSQDEIIHHYKIFKYVGTATDKSDFPTQPVVTVSEQTQISEVIESLGDEITYSFRVTACNSADECDDNNAILNITMPNTGAPQTTGISAINYVNGQVILDVPWTDSLGHVSKRSIYRATTALNQTCPTVFGNYTKLNEVLVTEPRDTPTQVAASGTLAEGSRYCFIVRDTDPSNNTEINTSIFFQDISDITKPNFISTVQLARDINLPETNVVASWTAMVNQNTQPLEGASAYEVFISSSQDPNLPDSNPCQNGTLNQTVDANNYNSGDTVTVNLGSLSPRNWHRVCVRAVDTALNYSTQEPAALTSTGDTTAPNFAGIQIAAINNLLGTIDFDFIVSPDSDVRNYRISVTRTRNGNVAAPVVLDKVYNGLTANQTATRSFTLVEAGLEGNDIAEIRVDVCDNASPVFNSQDNCSSTAATVTLTIPDITPPQNFLGVNTAAAGVAHRSILVDWQAPSSWEDYLGFKVYAVENGNLVPINSSDCVCNGNDCVANPKTSCEVTQFDSGQFLLPSKQYEIYVAAYDAAGNSTAQYIDYSGPQKITSLARASDLTSPDFSASIGLSYVSGVRVVFDAATDDQDPNEEIRYEFYRVDNSSFVCPLTPNVSTGGCDDLNPVATLSESSLQTEGSRLVIVDNDVADGNSYEYQICALDFAGNRQCQTGSVGQISIDDVTPPTIENALSLKKFGGNTIWDVTFDIDDNITDPSLLKVFVYKDVNAYPDPNNPGTAAYSTDANTVTVDVVSDGNGGDFGQASFTDTGTADVISMHYLIVVRDQRGNTVSEQLRDMLPAPVVTSAEWALPLDPNGHPIFREDLNEYPYSFLSDGRLTIRGQNLNSVVFFNENVAPFTPSTLDVRSCVTSRVSDRSDTEFKCSPSSGMYYDVAGQPGGYNLHLKDVHDRVIQVSIGNPTTYCDYADANNITELRGLGTSLTNAYALCSVDHIKLIGKNADNTNNNRDIVGTFVLGRDVDFTGVTDFKGIPSMSADEFSFFGGGNVISNLTIDNSATNQPAAFLLGLTGNTQGAYRPGFREVVFENIHVLTGSAKGAIVILNKSAQYAGAGPATALVIGDVSVRNSVLESNNTAGFIAADWTLSRDRFEGVLIRDSILRSSRTDPNTSVGGAFGRLTGEPAGAQVLISSITTRDNQYLPAQGQTDAGSNIGLLAGFSDAVNFRLIFNNGGGGGISTITGGLDHIGGVFGQYVGDNFEMSNVDIRNLKIQDTGSSANYRGGLIGLVADGASQINIGPRVEFRNGTQINGANHMGGMIGSISGHTEVNFTASNDNRLRTEGMSLLGTGNNIGGYIGSITNPSATVRFNKVRISGGSITGQNNVGGLVGYMPAGTLLEVSNGTHLQNSIIIGQDYVGGIAGYVGSVSQITVDSFYYRGSNNEDALVGYNYVGGLFGLVEDAPNLSLTKSAVHRDRTRAIVTGSGDYVGGLIGQIHWTLGGGGPTINMDTLGVFGSVVSGLSATYQDVWIGEINSNGGSNVTLSNSFYRNDYSVANSINASSSFDGIGVLTGVDRTQASSPATFTTWDFTNDWEILAAGTQNARPAPLFVPAGAQ